MKRIGLLLICFILFAASLYAAYSQGVNYVQINGPSGIHLSAPLEAGIVTLPFFWGGFLNLFSGMLNSLSALFAGSLIAAVIVLALLVELVTLYPAVNLQLKQKKIHLFHRKLVDRFRRGELAMSAGKRELDVLYSVNQRIHRRGAWLVLFQMIVLVLMFVGLSMVADVPSLLNGAFSSFNFALLSPPLAISLPLLASLAYLLHALVKIHLKQREDYIDARQVYAAVGIALIFAGAVFFFASIFAVLLSVFFLTLISFATFRYIIVEAHSKEWGKYVQRELVKMLKTADLHKNRWEHWSRKFNHMPIVRNLNFHLLEEAVSMSLAILLFMNSLFLL